MTYILGSIIAFLCINLSMVFLDQSFLLYIDHVAISMVLGGTFAVGVSRFPWTYRRDFIQQVKNVLAGPNTNTNELVKSALDYIYAYSNRLGFDNYPPALPGELLLDGRELLDLGFSTEEIETILQERIRQSGEKARVIAHFFLGLAKYPPAFGLVGTVFGLVNLMRAITEGLDPSLRWTPLSRQKFA